MTLLVALKGSDGMVLAADSRGTFGDPRGVTAQNDSIRKAFIFTSHVAAIQAGSAELGAMVLKQTQDAIAKQVGIDGVENVVNVLHQTSRASYDAWFPSLPQTAIPNPQTGIVIGRPDLIFIVGGYEKDQDGNFTRPVIYQLNSALNFAPMIHDYGFAVAGVPTYALYLLNRLYEADRKTQDLFILLDERYFGFPTQKTLDGCTRGALYHCEGTLYGFVASIDVLVIGLIA